LNRKRSASGKNSQLSPYTSNSKSNDKGAQSAGGRSSIVSSYRDFIAHAEYTKRGIVQISTKRSFMAAALQVLVSIVPLRNLLMNRDYSKYNKDSILGHVENIMKKIYSVDYGELKPRAFENLAKAVFSCKKRTTPS
jgi:hypothetical protein